METTRAPTQAGFMSGVWRKLRAWWAFYLELTKAKIDDSDRQW